MVFFALLEYGLILWIRFGRKYGYNWWIFNESGEGKIRNSRGKMNKLRCGNICKINDFNDILKHTIQESGRKDSQEINQRFDEKTIDKFCITMFPLSFAVFNMIYWYTFL